ncbi:MAG TPA: phosphoglucosamine mutase [Candidatus Cloacimonetes bacterium]|nr:phosphoglucosamine mutase [Candidatus Cloacimonadota bacterium]HEX37357.1 phosphoglucosamine mutase [Candidatus Cloacimonadota bacterium]
MSRLMKSVSGIRGIVGDTLNVELVLSFAKRFGVFTGRGRIVIGRDSRTTGKMLQQVVSAGLMSVGCDVIDIGICPTPTVLLAVENLNANGGIAITASHNPPEWNALKLINAEGTFLTPEQGREFWNIPEQEFVDLDWEKVGSLSNYENAIDDHIRAILGLDVVAVNEIREVHFKVVIDSTNGAGGLMSPGLLKALNCEVIELFSEPTGKFSRVAEPVAKNLTELEKVVKENNADIGFATDPDVDRLSIVSDKGKALGTEFTLLLAEKYILSQEKGCIATNLSSSMASEEIAKEYGIKVFRTPVGEINVAQAMKKHGCVIGGEGNGGVIYPNLHFTRDAPLAMTLILSYMAKTGKKISELVVEIPHYFMYKTKIEIDAGLDFTTLESDIQKDNVDLKIDRQDGIKLIADDYWIHIRKSGTEPIVRVIAESDTEEKSEKLCDKIITKYFK